VTTAKSSFIRPDANAWPQPFRPIGFPRLFRMVRNQKSSIEIRH
jgi:hypothetical protein